MAGICQSVTKFYNWTQNDSVTLLHAHPTSYKCYHNSNLKTLLGRSELHNETVIMFHAVSGSSHLFDNRPGSTAPTRKMAGRFATTKHNKARMAHISNCFTHLFRCNNCKNTGMWSALAAIIQIHSISEEVFPLMPAWKLPSSWQPEAEENGRELASPKVNMATEIRSLTISVSRSWIFLLFDILNKGMVFAIVRYF